MKKLLLKLLFVIAIFSFNTNGIQAQIIPYIASINTPYQGAPVTIGQPTAKFVLQATPPNTNEADLQVQLSDEMILEVRNIEIEHVFHNDELALRFWLPKYLIPS